MSVSRAFSRAAAALQPAVHARSFHASAAAGRLTTLQTPGDSAKRTVSVFPGHGIGPEMTGAAMRVLEASSAPLEFEVVDNVVDTLTPEVLDSFRKNKVALKGEFQVAVGRGSKRSINVDLRKSLDLYANVVHTFPIPGTFPRHENVDIVVVRESTEGEYSGMEHEVAPGITESLKVMTRDATIRIAEYAFEHAFLNNRAKVTAVHKANIMKKADGLFLESCRNIAKRYPSVQYEEIIVDNCMMQLVSKPQQFDVMVTPNMYGSLVSNVVAGLVGGPGLVPGATIGKDGAIFEQGARHTAFDIAGKGVANPTGMLFAAVLMLRHLKLGVFADRVEHAIFSTLADGCKTGDIGGNANLDTFVQEVCQRVHATGKSQ